MTVYCYDTEFLEDGKTIELISIGIVCEDGREYYAVNSEMPADRICKDKWMLENVWRHLPLRGHKMTPHTIGGKIEMRTKDGWEGSLDTSSTLVKPKWVIANEVREFLLAARKPELWAYYAAYDHVALAQLWGRMISLPDGIPMYTHDLKQEMDRVGARGSEFPAPDSEHDALADARWNMAVLKHLRGTDGTPDRINTRTTP